MIWYADDPWSTQEDLNNLVQTILQKYVGEKISDKTIFCINQELKNVCNMLGRNKPIIATVEEFDRSVINIQY
jgi:hypothetical protein